MIRTSSMYEACHDLFSGYSLAVEPVSRDDRTVQSMVLLVRNGDDARFYSLSHGGGDGTPYRFRPWPAGTIVDIEDESRHAVSGEVVNAVATGVPIPRNGSLFGWIQGGTVAALLTIRIQYEEHAQPPSWAVMPLAGLPEAQWPTFTGDRFFGQWFWDDYQAGRAVLLANAIAANPRTVYWVDTKTVLGSACCAVAHDIRSLDGYTLGRGRYVYYKALRADQPVPPLEELLADPSKIDLAPLFR